MNELAQRNSSDAISPMSSVSAFSDSLRIATAIAKSDFIPAAFRDRPENIVIAMDMANRIGAGLFAVMQSLHVIHGRPGFSAQFLIATLNNSGEFGKLRYVFEGDGMGRSCYAEAKDNATGLMARGVTVSMAMAKAEKWIDKVGSKWQTMPDLMLTYRAAAFFIRTYAPGISLGLMTAEEAADIEPDLAAGDRYAVKTKARTKAPAEDAPAVTTVTIAGYAVDVATGEVGPTVVAAKINTAQEAALWREEAPEAAAVVSAAPAAQPAPESPPAADPAAPAPASAIPDGESAHHPALAMLKGAPAIAGDLTPGSVRVLGAKLKDAGIGAYDVCVGIGGPITKASLNDALEWIGRRTP